MAPYLMLLRHGQTDYNVQRRIQGRIDIPLNEIGKQQAYSAGKALADFQITSVYASPLQRARQTAEIIAHEHDLPVTVCAGLAERDFGPWEGLQVSDIEKGWPQQYALWRQSGDPDPEMGIEKRSAVGERVARAIEQFMPPLVDTVLQAAEFSPTDTSQYRNGVILAVAHGSAITQGICNLLGLDPKTWQGLGGLSNCHWALLERSLRSPGWVLRGYNLAS